MSALEPLLILFLAASFLRERVGPSLTLGVGPFRTWCAYDSLGIAAALGGDAQVETTCGQCHAPISLACRAGNPERNGPERRWLADGGSDLRGSFCSPTVLLCGEEHGMAWAAGQSGRVRRPNEGEAGMISAIIRAGKSERTASATIATCHLNSG